MVPVRRRWQIGLAAAAVVSVLAPVPAAPAGIEREFGRAGVASVELGDVRPVDAAATLDGGIVVAAVSGGGDVFRFTADGRLDSGWGRSGAFDVPLPAFLPSAIAVGAGGRTIVGGFSEGPEKPEFAGYLRPPVLTLVALDERGRLDPTFSGDGIVTLDLGPYEEIVLDVAIDAAGRILASHRIGQSRNGSGLSRFLPDGRLDPSFDGDGTRIDDVDGDFVALVVDGVRPVAIGQELCDAHLVAFDQTGRPDPTFGTGGRAVIPGEPDTVVGEGCNARLPTALARDADGRIAAAFYGNLGMEVRVFLRDGRPDPAFSGDGVLVLDPGLATSIPRALIFDADGGLVVGHYATTFLGRQRLTRIDRAGVVDPGFGCNGLLGVEGLDVRREVAALTSRGGRRIAVVAGEGGFEGPMSRLVVVAVDGADATAGPGYVFAGGVGGVEAFGAAGQCDAFPTIDRTVSMASTPSGAGQYRATGGGAVLTGGDARAVGDLAGRHLNGPVVGIAADPDGAGYLLAAADGGVFAFGTAFHGSLGGRHLNAPVVGIVMTTTGGGYWLIAADGGVFSFGDARFEGSLGSERLDSSIVAMTADRDGGGYLMVDERGAVQGFAADVVPGPLPQAPALAIAADPDGRGYWIADRRGAVTAYDAPHLGDLSDRSLPDGGVAGFATTG